MTLDRNLNGFITIVLTILIAAMGVFRPLIFDHLYLMTDSFFLYSTDGFLNQFLQAYGSGKDGQTFIIHYLVYYPLYLALHFLLIHFLYKDNLELRKKIKKGLSILLIFLITGKVIFGLIDAQFLEEYFSFAFHKLIALPFLLLAIEGGRSLYEIIDKYYQ